MAEVQKDLAGQEDLLWGEGTVTQTRNSQNIVISKLRGFYPVNSANELTTLDHNKFPKAVVVSGTTVQFYKWGGAAYVPLSVSGSFNPAPSGPASLGIRFLGVFGTEADLYLASPTPTDGYQAIVLQPSEYYYHAVGQTWVKLVPVVSVHPSYLGSVASEASLSSLSPSEGSLALANKSFYVFKGGKWVALANTDLTSLAKKIEDVKTEVTGLHSSISSNTSKVSQVEALLSVTSQQLSSEIAAKPNGIHLEDVDGNAFDDMTGITFEGATVVDDGSYIAHVTIKPEISLTNGRTPDSTSVTAKALEFPGSTITLRDPEGAKVGVVSIPTSSQTAKLRISDGVGAATDVQEVHLKGSDLQVTPDGSTVNIGIEFKHFKTIADRDQWTTKYGGVITSPLICVVDADEDGFTQSYAFDPIHGAWRDYDLQGVVMADSNGAIPKNIKTVIYGPGFSIQQAGDKEDAALVTYAGSSSDGISLNMLGGQSNKVESIDVYPPLETYADPDKTKTGRLLIKPGTFEPAKAPSFLAYISEDVEIVGTPDDIANGREHHGAIWFDNVIVPSGMYISTDIPNKAYGIEEADNLDPNVTGGTKYLISFRAAMRGTAPSDGFIRAYLKYNGNLHKSGYVMDTNGQPVIYERHYKKGDELGTVTAAGVVTAKGQEKFTCYVIANFTGDSTTLTDRTEGGTGLMIQAITKDYKTGDALQQYELDTQQNIEFSSHYLGEDRATINYFVSRPDPIVSYTADTHIISSDGWRVINPNGMKLGVVDGHMRFLDDGVHVCDFNFGKVFSSEETLMLRGHEIDFTAMLTDKNDGFNVSLMKWLGTPDEYTPEIFTTRNNDTPIFQANWVKVDNLFISENAAIGDHTVTKTFTVPEDANNYAVIIYPAVVQQPLHLRLKQFKIDVTEPFIGVSLHDPELISEKHLEFNREYRQLTQDNQGYGSLRYTINDAEQASPVGILGKGLADISLDTTVNTISGSVAKGGEGAVSFSNEGTATIQTSVRLWNEQASSSQVHMWWAKVVGNPGSETYDKIADSEGVFQVPANSKGAVFSLPHFTVDVDSGERLALRMQGDKDDAAFLQCVSAAAPLVWTSINFEELVATSALVSTDASKKVSVDRRIHSFTGNSSQNVTFSVEIPDGVHLANVSVARLSSQSITEVNNVGYSYDKSTGMLTVPVGPSVTSGEIYMEFWA